MLLMAVNNCFQSWLCCEQKKWAALPIWYFIFTKDGPVARR
jgi:hypothetical protein